MIESSANDIFLNYMKSQNKEAEIVDEKKKIRKGKIVAVSNSDVYIDLGDKSEVLIPIEEFETKPEIGSFCSLILKDMREGIYYGSKLEAERIIKLSTVRDCYKNNLAINGKIVGIISKSDKPKGFEVDLGASIKAFLPLSQIDTKEFDSLDKFIGKSYDFAVIDMNKNSITLSRKEYLKNTINKMYDLFFNKHKVDDIVKGKVEKVDEKYLILNIEGVRAFLHISDFSWKYLTDLSKYVQFGDELEVKIIELDKEKKSVVVSKKHLTEDPWSKVEKKYKVNDIIKCKVINFRKNGAIVEIEDGVEGFIDVDEMSWTEKIKDPKKYLKKGMILETKIKNIDIEKRKIDLSLREIQENPWNNADKIYTYGRKLTGRITSIFDFGVFVKFDDGIEGLLRKEDVDWLEKDINLKKKFRKGQKIDVVVLSLDKENEKLRLGIKQLSENPYKTFSLNYPKGTAISAKVKEILENGVIVELENNLEGFIHISQISKEKVEKIEDYLKVGDLVKAEVRMVDVNKNKIELSIKDYLLHEEQHEVKKYIVSSDNVSNSISIGSLLKDKSINLNIPATEKNENKVKDKNDKELKEEKNNVDKFIDEQKVYNIQRESISENKEENKENLEAEKVVKKKINKKKSSVKIKKENEKE